MSRSKHLEKCVGCGSTDRKHHGRGLCRRCYIEKYRKENREKEKLYYIARNHKRAFGEGNRELVLARSDRKCVHCGNPATDVHHIDNDGESSVSWIDRWIGNIGHDPNRMEALCHSCHMREHGFHNKGKDGTQDAKTTKTYR